MPDSEIVRGGGEKVGFGAIFVGYEDGLSGWVRVVKGERRVGFDFAGGIVELDDFDTVLGVFEEGGDGEAVVFVAADAPVHGVDVPWCFVGVDFRALLMLFIGEGFWVH